MLQLECPAWKSNVTLAALYQPFSGSSQLSQKYPGNRFHPVVGSETMFSQHVPVVLGVVAQIFVTAIVVLSVGNTQVPIKFLLGRIQRETNAAFHRFRILVALLVHFQFLLAVVRDNANVAYEMALDLRK